MIVARVVSGVSSHFHVRLPEWVMIVPALGMGVAMVGQPDMFSLSPSFAGVQRIMPQEVWASLVLLCATARLAALTVNGTFTGFRFSPHIRAVASFVGVGFWGSFASGFVQSAVAGGGSWSAVVAYSTFVLLEMANVYRAMRDTGGAARG